MVTRPVEILASELDDKLYALACIFECMRLLVENGNDAVASYQAKYLYEDLLKAADAAWKIHESLEKGEGA